MTTTMTPVQSQNDFNQNEIPYLNERNKAWLLESLSDNRKFEFLMFNLWRTRGILYNILEKDDHSEDIKNKFGDQFHAINDLIGVLLDGTDWSQDLFMNNPPKKRF